METITPQIINKYGSYLTADVDDLTTTLEVYIAPTGVTPTATNPLTLTLDDGLNVEVVRVTGISGKVLTVVRGYEHTAKSWGVGSIIECRLTTRTLLEIAENSGVLTTQISGVVPTLPSLPLGPNETTLTAPNLGHLVAAGDTVSIGGMSTIVKSRLSDSQIVIQGSWDYTTVTRPPKVGDHIQRQGALNVWRS